MLKTLSEKLGAKFPATTPGCSIVKIARLDDAFLIFFYLQASPVEGQSLLRKEKKRRKQKGEKKIKNQKAQGRRSLSPPNFKILISKF